MTHSTLAPQLHSALLACRPLLSAGPVCLTCMHRSCRAHRAEAQPRQGGQRMEFASEHAEAKRVQALNPGVLVWYGETTQSYWIATASGLSEVENIEALDNLVKAVV